MRFLPIFAQLTFGTRPLNPSGMNTEIWKIDDTMRSIKHDEASALWYVDIDGQAVAAETLEGLETKLRDMGHTIVRYPAR